MYGLAEVGTGRAPDPPAEATMYATKRRQRNLKSRPERSEPSGAVAGAKASGTSSNPSKRHRERLNGELETVASLLPFDPPVLTRLDKLSVLRLAVSYLQAKTHFQESVRRQFFPSAYYGGGGYGALGSGLGAGLGPGLGPGGLLLPGQPPGLLSAADKVFASEEKIFKALGGFVLILNENGEIYYTSENIETYLGFHQSDILHQPVFDMVHSEDREELRAQLSWAHGLAPGSSFGDVCGPDGLLHLHRQASARFRCLLDNTCGFLRIDVRGKLTLLHGLPACFLAARPDPSLPVLGLLAVCTPFVPPPALDGPDTEPFLKTKHSLDFSLFSLDPKAKILLELEDKHLPASFYATVHHQDAPCLGEAHKEALKNGASGLLVYRLISRRSRRTYWLQSSCRLFYKNGKPESIGCTHRLLTEVEGETLLEKRASLSAKLLSFDDSLLQSPKLLQSTAALTNSELPSGKSKSKRFRPPTVSTSFRDPSLRGSMSSIRSAAAALAASLPSSLPGPPTSGLASLPPPLPPSLPTYAPAYAAHTPPQRPSSAPKTLPPAPSGYYPYLAPPSELYVAAPPSGRPLSPQTGLSAHGWVLPTAYPSPDLPLPDSLRDSWTSAALRPPTLSSALPPHTMYHSAPAPPPPLPPSFNFNFPISEVTNTLLGQ